MKPFLWIFLPLLIAYASTLGWCVDRWNAPGGYFEHCWLLPPLAAAILWWRRRDYLQRPARLDLAGCWLLGLALLLHLAGAAWMIDSLSAMSLLLAVPGAAWLALGRQRLAGQWPVLWLVCFLVPAPIYVEGRLTFVLKEFAVAQGTALANLLGAGIVRAGADLQLAGTNQRLFVADACSGLRSLLAMLTVAYCLAFFSGSRNLLRRGLLLAVALPIAVLANVARIALLCLLARWFGVPFTDSYGHDLANALEWLSALASLWLLDSLLLSRLRAAKPPASAASAMPAMSQPGRALWPVGVVLWVLAVPLLWLSVYRPLGGSSDRAARLPEQLASWQLEPRSELEEQQFQRALPRWIELLGTADFVWRRYRNPDRHRIQLVALFHDSNWKSVHPPRICIEGSNMDIETDDLIAAPWLSPGAQLGRIVARSRSDGWRYLTLSVFGTQQWAAGSYSDFTLYHLPRAFWRQNESGFLLRVETPVRADEPLAAAAARCQEFLQALLPAAREVLR